MVLNTRSAVLLSARRGGDQGPSRGLPAREASERMERMMTVIANNTLLVRRLGELRRRREALADRQERLRSTLPEWALAPLQLVGMTATEIKDLMHDLSE